MKKHINIFILAALAVSLILSMSGCGNTAIEKEESAKKDHNFIETIEEQDIIDEQGVRVSIKKIQDDEDYGKNIELEYSNSTIAPLMFNCKSLVVNGIQIEDPFGELLESGETKTGYAYLSSVELQAMGIDTIGEIKMQFDFFNPDTYDIHYSAEPVSVKTSEYDNMKTELDFNGKLLYDKNDIKIYGKYVASSSLYDSTLMYYIDNKRDDNLMLVCEAIFLNDTEIYGQEVFTVVPHASLLGHIVYSKDVNDVITKYKLDDIDSVTADFKIYDRGDLSVIDTTGPLTFKCK